MNEHLQKLAHKLQDYQDCDKIISIISNTLISYLKFKRLRFYLNYSSDQPNPRQQNITWPVLVLVKSIGHDEKNIENTIVNNEILFEPCFIENRSIYDYLVKVKNEKKLHIFSDAELIQEGDVKSLNVDLNLTEKWLELPLWKGDQLIGVICLDFHQNLELWDSVSPSILDELVFVSTFCATAIQNCTLNNVNRRFEEISKKLSNILSNQEQAIEDSICNLLKNNYSNLEIVYYKYQGTNKFSIIAASFDLKNLKSKSYFLNNNNKSEILLDLICGKHLINSKYFINKLDIIDLMNAGFNVSSVIDIYLRSHNKYLGVLRILRLESGLPLSIYDYLLFKKVGEQIGEIIYAHNVRDEYLKIISTISSLISEKVSIQAVVKNYLKNIHKIYPETFITIFKISQGKLNFLDYTGDITPARELDLKNMYYLLPPNDLSNEEKIKWIKKEKVGASPFFIYSNITKGSVYFKTRSELKSLLSTIYNVDQSQVVTKYDTFIPEVRFHESEYIKILFYNKNPIGLIRFQDRSINAYDQDFFNFVDILGNLMGNIIGLLNDIEIKEDYERSLIHALRSPVTALTNWLDYYLDLFQIKDHDLALYKDDLSPFSVPKKDIFKFISMINNETEILTYFVKNPRSFDLQKENNIVDYGEYFNIQRTVSKICRIMKYYTDSKGLNISWHNLLSKEIFGIEGDIAIALYNIINNAIKYSTKLKIYDYKYKQIEISSIQENNLFKIFIKNYGITVKSQEIPFLFEKYNRGSNSNKIEGEGLGLYISKVIFEKHLSTIDMEVDENNCCTILVICIDLFKNKRLGKGNEK